MRWWSHGSADIVKKPMPPTGAVAAYFEFAASYAGNDCLMWAYSDNGSGYGLMQVDGERRLVHRCICERVNGPAPSENHHAAHGCGNGHLGCITPGHLRWATAEENSFDMIKHGTRIRGENHPNAKLDVGQVVDIFERPGPQTEIAAVFGVSQTLVGMIKRGKRWAWLTHPNAGSDA